MGWLPLVSGSSFDSATTAWVNAVVTAGGTVSTTQKGYVDTLITTLKSNSLFTIMDRIWLLASENTQQANIDIINLGTWTSHGTETFSANHGYTGDGSTGYLDTNYAPSIAAGNFTLNSNNHGVYILTNRTSGATYAAMGTTALDNGTETWIYPWFTDNNDYVANCNSAANHISATTVKGLWVNSRTSSTVSEEYLNGASHQADNTNTAGFNLSERSFVIGARRDGGGGAVSDFSADQIAAAWIGGGLTSGQASTLSTAINAYMTSLGVNVY